MTTPQEPGDAEPKIPAPPPPLTEAELQGTQPTGGPPRELQLSFVLWVITAVLVLLTSVILFIGREEAAKQARSAAVEGVTPEQLEAVAITTATALAVVGLMIALLVGWASTKLRLGVTWARILLTVVGIAIILFNMIGFSWIGVLTAIAAFGGVVTMYLRPANDFFVANKQPR